MSLTPPEPIRFMPKMLITDQQLHVLVEEYARNKAGFTKPVGDEHPGHSTSYLAFVEDFRNVKLLADFVNAKVDGMTQYVKEILVPNLNLAYDQIETEVGFERLSNPKTNYIQNGGFRLWNAAVNLPNGWTSSGSPTITRVTGRALPPTTTQGGNYGCRIAAGGAAGSISRTFRVKGGSIYRCAGWVNVEAAGSFTITLLDNGTGAVASVFTRTAAQIGAVGWFSFPRIGYDQIGIQTTSDATSCTVTLESTTANKYVTFSDFQCVQGPNADPDLWEPAPEDIESAPALLPNGTPSSQIFSQIASVTVTNTDAETSLLSTGGGIVGSPVLAAGFLTVGKTIRLRASGYYSLANTAAQTLTIRYKLGSTTIVATAALSKVNNLTNVAWSCDVELTCRTVGATGTVSGQSQGGFILWASTTALASVLGAMVTTADVTIDTTASQSVDFTADWNSAAGDSITCTNLTIEAMG